MPNPSELEALYAGVLADPASDAPRLVYADWLEEYGDGDGRDRASFIRVQIAHHNRHAAGVPLGKLYPHGDPELTIVGRMPRFLAVLGEIEDYGWNGTGTTRIEYASGAEAAFRRGFVSHVTLPLAAWLEHGRALAGAHPLESVRLSDRGPARSREAWYWYRPGAGDETLEADMLATLPDPIFDLLDEEYCADEAGWEEQADAVAALSDACLLWARRG